MKKTFSFLHGLMLLAAVSLCAAQAGAQNEALRPQVEEMYKAGLLGTWMNGKEIKNRITNIYVQSMEATSNPEVLKLSKEQKRWRASRVAELYMKKRMEEDAVYLLTVCLPDTTTKAFLDRYKQYQEREQQNAQSREYLEMLAKIQTMPTDDSCIQKQIEDYFLPALKKYANRKLRKPKAVEALPCPESYQTAFAGFWEKSEYAQTLMSPIDLLCDNIARNMSVYIYFADKYEREKEEKAAQKDMNKRKEKMKEFCSQNGPIFWRNRFIEKGITEDDLRKLTPNASKEEQAAFEQFDQRMMSFGQDNQTKMIRNFAAWHSRWSKDEKEDHSILSAVPSPQELKEMQEQAEEQIFEKPDILPSFPGGDIALLEFLSKNIKYPSICQEQSIHGRVYASFVVEKDGSITNIKIMRSPHPAMSGEATRMLKIMPRWVPGKLNGKPVRVKFSVPIMFRLN